MSKSGKCVNCGREFEVPDYNYKILCEDCDIFMTPQEQPDSQAGDELEAILKPYVDALLEGAKRALDGDYRKVPQPNGMPLKEAVRDYAERLATEARIDELNKVSNWELPDLYSQPYLESMCDKRIATLTAKADTDEDGDPVQHTTWRKQA